MNIILNTLALVVVIICIGLLGYAFFFTGLVFVTIPVLFALLIFWAFDRIFDVD